MIFLMNVTPFARVILALTSLQLLYSALGAAIPSDHELVKRANVNCVSRPPDTELIFEDCLSAILNMGLGGTAAQRNAYQYFGSSMTADVKFQLLSWNFGTCTVQMAPESTIDQVSSWTKIITTALRVAQTCVHQLSPSQMGNSYVDRPPSDPSGAFFGPSLHIWIFPSAQSKDQGPEASVGSNDLETCAVKHRQGITDPPGCAWDTLSTASSVVGGGL